MKEGRKKSLKIITVCAILLLFLAAGAWADIYRYIDENGKTLFEVTSIKTDKQLAADYDEVRAGMKQVDMNAQLEQAQQLQDLISDMDDDTKKQLQDMLKQLQ